MAFIHSFDSKFSKRCCFNMVFGPYKVYEADAIDISKKQAYSKIIYK